MKSTISSVSIMSRYICAFTIASSLIVSTVAQTSEPTPAPQALSTNAPTPAATETCSAPATESSCTTNPNQFCKLPTNSCTVGTGVCSDKPQTCTANVAFVCGCDGVTYTNECLAWFAGTSVFSEGKCETTSPTVSPTEIVVTNSPTVSPSDKPVTNEPTTSEPTNKPSVSPVTDAPSPNPVTDIPTKAPQLTPTTDGPTTVSPTKSPTNKPTVSPTDRPTKSPTQKPSDEPTLNPTTEDPTISPSESPTKSPTSKPTTGTPTSSPTVRPSKSPVIGPTTEDPTLSPSDKPSPSPSVSPTTAAPTEVDATTKPTISPVVSTESPTQAPQEGTATPTLFVSSPPTTPGSELLGPITTTGLKMILKGQCSIPNNSEYEQSTGDAFVDAYDNSSDLYDTKVEITISNTAGTCESSRRLSGGSRSLQASDPSVEVTYTQTMYYRTRDTGLSNNEIFSYPLSTEPLRDQYIGELKLLDGYEDLTAVSTISISDDSNKGVDGGNDAGGLSTGAIIGIACGGGAALIMLIAGYVYYKKKNNDDEEFIEGSQADRSGTLSGTQGMMSGTSGVGTGSSVPTYGDQSVATVDYDYSRAYGGAGGQSLSEAGGTLGSRTRQTAADEDPNMVPGSGGTIFSDDQTFDRAYQDDTHEELMDFYAPAGKLGVVIDTPDDGAPVVHAVKDTSPICGKVMVGDKLVAVDDEDVRAMTAIKVSKLISRKSNNASRKLTIIRNVPNQR